jgi:hypothetical protein
LAESIEARPETDTPVSVRETADGALFIETGGNQWAVEQSGTMPFSRAYLGEREVLPNDGVQSSVRFDGENFELRIGTRPVVEEAGPLRVVVRADGIALGADGSPGFDVTARIYAHAGCSWLRVYLTLTNRIRQKLVHLEEFKVSLAPTLDAGTAYEHAFLVSNVDVGHHVSNVDELTHSMRFCLGPAVMERIAGRGPTGAISCRQQPCSETSKRRLVCSVAASAIRRRRKWP